MPIKPENKALYPSNWREIRDQILERAAHRCEFCKAPNGEIIARGRGKDAGSYMICSNGRTYTEGTGEYRGQGPISEYEIKNVLRVVLTIMHLDHDPTNNDPGNLRGACQKCHLSYDAQHHSENARKTRRERKAMGDLFVVKENGAKNPGST